MTVTWLSPGTRLTVNTAVVAVLVGLRRSPPSSAPDTYQARKTCSFQPMSVVVASVNVPTP